MLHAGRFRESTYQLPSTQVANNLLTALHDTFSLCMHWKCIVLSEIVFCHGWWGGDVMRASHVTTSLIILPESCHGCQLCVMTNVVIIMSQLWLWHSCRGCFLIGDPPREPCYVDEFCLLFWGGGNIAGIILPVFHARFQLETWREFWEIFLKKPGWHNEFVTPLISVFHTACMRCFQTSAVLGGVHPLWLKKWKTELWKRRQEAGPEKMVPRFEKPNWWVDWWIRLAFTLKLTSHVYLAYSIIDCFELRVHWLWERYLLKLLVLSFTD